ncbi:MAG: proton-conducting transporter membrane subunit [Kiloniellales bacterium]
MIYLLPLLAPALLIAAAAAAFYGPGFRPRLQVLLAEIAAFLSFALALASALLLGLHGAATAPLIGNAWLAIAPRVDMLSVIMFLLVSAIGWVVLRYAATYLDGEERQGPFTGWMCLTLASVLLLVQAGTLLQLAIGWIATSVFLHRLLLFYSDRIAAQRAARKKLVTARIGDVALIAAAVLLASAYGSGRIETILAAAGSQAVPGAVLWAAGLLAIAALLKSAQFPTHGWLSEVMETPTPVSALLHAGVINAGGFLLIRFADVMLTAPMVLAVLVAVGGFTALFGGLVMLTQPAVKTSLAWSTVAQMGFMILQCGLALFPLALLHIVAHSLYKAHAFLASGNAVDTVASIRRPGPVAIPSALAVSRSFLIAIAIYALVAFSFGAGLGFEGKSPQAFALGAILIFGVAYLLAQGLADAAPRALTKRIAVYSVGAALGYFALHAISLWLMAGTLPATPMPGPLEWALIGLAVASFAVVAVAQALFPNWAYHPAAAGLRVHLSNGLYVNALFDRLLGAWARRGTAVS